MKKLYLVVSIALGIILLVLFPNVLQSIGTFVVFLIVSILFISSLANYQECKRSLKQAREERVYE